MVGWKHVQDARVHAVHAPVGYAQQHRRDLPRDARSTCPGKREHCQGEHETAVSSPVQPRLGWGATAVSLGGLGVEVFLVIVRGEAQQPPNGDGSERSALRADADWALRCTHACILPSAPALKPYCSNTRMTDVPPRKMHAQAKPIHADSAVTIGSVRRKSPGVSEGFSAQRRVLVLVLITH